MENLDLRRPAWTAIRKYLGSSSYWNSVILRPFLSQIVSRWGISPARQGTLHQYENVRRRDSLELSLFGQSTKEIECGSVGTATYSFSYCMRAVPSLPYTPQPTPSYRLRIFYSYFASDLESIFFNKHNFGWILLLFKLMENATAKFVTNFFVCTCYIFQNLLLVTCLSETIFHIFVFALSVDERLITW